MGRRHAHELALAVGGAFFALATVAAADVFRCTEDGKTVYSDKPCAADARKIPIAGAKPPMSRLGPPGTKLKVSDAVTKDCFDRYRVLARDPTNIKTLYTRAEIAPSGYPFVEIEVVLPNRSGGPQRTGFYCSLTDNLVIDEDQLKPATRRFFEEQLN